MREQTVSELIAECLEAGSEPAWRRLVLELQPVVASTLVRIVRRYGDQNLALVDDLVQETFLRLCRENSKVLRQFKPQHEGAIYGFAKVVAASVAADHFRAANARKRAGETAVDPEALDRIAPVPRASADRGLVMQQIEQALQRVTATREERTQFWLYYRQGFTAVEIAAMPGVQLSAKGVESSLLRLVKAVRREMDRKAPAAEGQQTSSALGGLR